MSDGPLVLGIETSCDETGVGIVRGNTLLADAVASSVDEHARFGGVVPEVASRAHLEAMVPTIERACETAGVQPYDVDAIAVTSGPGLAGALLVGVAAAKALALGLGKPLYGVNHLASHVAVDQLEHGPLPEPCLALLVSGGHSSLLRVEDVTGDVDPLGATIDDAAGEAFDKVARLLGLPFPGGPHIDRAAREGDSVYVDFPRGLTSRRDLERHRFDFSFSGLKTAVARWVEARERSGEPVPLHDVAASFQEAVCDVLTRKAIDAAATHGIDDLLIGGGVAANSRLRSMAEERAVGARDPGPGSAARTVHRQRRDGGRAGCRDGDERSSALGARPPGRLVAAGDLRAGVTDTSRCHPNGWLGKRYSMLRSAVVSGGVTWDSAPSSSARTMLCSGPAHRGEHRVVVLPHHLVDPDEDLPALRAAVVDHWFAVAGIEDGQARRTGPVGVGGETDDVAAVGAELRPAGSRRCPTAVRAGQGSATPEQDPSPRNFVWPATRPVDLGGADQGVESSEVGQLAARWSRRRTRSRTSRVRRREHHLPSARNPTGRSGCAGRPARERGWGAAGRRADQERARRPRSPPRRRGSRPRSASRSTGPARRPRRSTPRSRRRASPLACRGAGSRRPGSRSSRRRTERAGRSSPGSSNERSGVESRWSSRTM